MLSGGVFKFGTGWVINLELKEERSLATDRPLWSEARSLRDLKILLPSLKIFFCFSSRDHRSCIIQRCLWKDFVLQIITIKILF